MLAQLLLLDVLQLRELLLSVNTGPLNGQWLPADQWLFKLLARI